MENRLHQLLAHCMNGVFEKTHSWQAWQITRIDGGANNLLYRATSADADYAVKFTVRDARRRAWREYTALSAIDEAGLDIAPRALWLDETSYRQPVIVQTWMAGEGLQQSPQTDEEWTALLDHYYAIHTVTPDRTATPLLLAVNTMDSISAAKLLIADHVARLPSVARPASLLRILTWFDAWQPAEWSVPVPALCRTDLNWRNFVRRPGGLASVDWENSGWGDPAFEIADMMTHPAYEDIVPSRWEWLGDAYAERCGDAAILQRIYVYHTAMQVWWVVRMARYLYEAPRGLDERLVPRPPDWQTDTEQKYARFVGRAEQAMHNPKPTSHLE